MILLQLFARGPLSLFRVFAANNFQRLPGPKPAVTALVASLLLGIGSVEQSSAQSAICNQLSAQLASLQSGNVQAVDPRYREYDDAVRQQQAQLTKTRKIAKRTGCLKRGLFALLNKTNSRCGRILDGIDRMEVNLEKLKDTRERFAPRQAGGSRERNLIIKRMQQRRCNLSGVIDTRQVKADPNRRRSLVEQIFGVRTYGDDGRRGIDEYGVDLDIANQYNTFRTLCVRTCDGYYFPISFSTVPGRFENDEQTCQAMCPGTEVSLYHHRMPLEDSEEMISYRTLIPYAEQPYAFSYRKAINPECGCRFSTGDRFQTAAGDYNTDQTIAHDSPPRIGTPTFRVDPALDPETQDNRMGNLTFKKIALMLKDPASNGTGTEVAVASDRKVRVVGPAFYPVQ